MTRRCWGRSRPGGPRTPAGPNGSARVYVHVPRPESRRWPHDLRIRDVFGLPVEAVFSREPFVPMSTTVYERRIERQGGTDA